MNRNMMMAHEISNAIQDTAGQLTQVMPLLGAAFTTLAGQVLSIASMADDIDKHDCLMGRGPVARAMYARDQMEGVNPPRTYRPHRLNYELGEITTLSEEERRAELRPFLESIRCFLRDGGEMDFGTSRVILKDGRLNLSEKVASGAFNESIMIPLYPSYNEPSATYISMWENQSTPFTVDASAINYSYLRSDMLMRFGKPCCPFVEPVSKDSITRQLLTNELFLISKHQCDHLIYVLESEPGVESSRIQFIVEQPDEVLLSLRIVHRGKLDDINGFKSNYRGWNVSMLDNLKWDDLPYYLQHLIAGWLPGGIAEHLDKHKEFLIERIALEVTVEEGTDHESE